MQDASSDAKPAPRAAAAPSGDLLGALFSSGQPAQPAASEKSDQAEPAQPKRQRVTGFGPFLRAVGDVVQSGSVRASGNNDRNDFYMIPLTQESLRPGTVYADPYGHVLMLVQRIPETADAAGIFFAVDAEPDGSVTRKRFWRGNFLFVHDPSLGSPGFKRFRPVVSSRAADCARSPMRRSRRTRTTATSRCSRRKSERKNSTIAWTR